MKNKDTFEDKDTMAEKSTTKAGEITVFELKKSETRLKRLARIAKRAEAKTDAKEAKAKEAEVIRKSFAEKAYGF
jgi:hypothetical protein